MDTTCSEYSIEIKKLGHTSERLGSQVLASKVALHQSGCGITDHQRIGLSQSLKTGSEIRDFSECQLFLTPCSAHFPHHNKPSMDTHTESELDAFCLLQTAIEF